MKADITRDWNSDPTGARNAVAQAKMARTLPRWTAMIDRFRKSQADSLCLTGHASYLLRSGGISFGVDLAFLDREWRASLLPRAAEDFRSLRFALLTHLHGDHFDPVLLQTIGAWAELIVPEFIGEDDLSMLKRQARAVRVVRPGDRFAIDGACITVLDGLHHDDGGPYGVDAVGYFVETPSLKLLFPGDVRDYRAGKLLALPRADVAFAHVWLGRGNALNLPCEPYLSRFAAFWQSVNPRHILLTHLEDDTRETTDLWTDTHALLIEERLASACPQMRRTALHNGAFLSPIPLELGTKKSD